MGDGYLTTHVLDTARGVPAADIEITLYRIDGDSRQEITRMRTNSDGRTDAPILPKGAMAPGTYELVFETGAYLDRNGLASAAGPKFLDTIPIRFGIDDGTAHYHVPLLLSPYGYSTYRGS